MRSLRILRHQLNLKNDCGRVQALHLDPRGCRQSRVGVELPPRRLVLNEKHQVGLVNILLYDVSKRQPICLESLLQIRIDLLNG